MKKKNNIDDLFRSMIEPDNNEPSGENWDSISSILDKKQAEMRNKKRRRILLIFFFAALLTTIGTYQYFKHDSSAALQNSTTETTETEKLNAEKENNNSTEIKNSSSDKIEKANDNPDLQKENSIEDKTTEREKFITEQDPQSSHEKKVAERRNKKAAAAQIAIASEKKKLRYNPVDEKAKANDLSEHSARTNNTKQAGSSDSKNVNNSRENGPADDTSTDSNRNVDNADNNFSDPSKENNSDVQSAQDTDKGQVVVPTVSDTNQPPAIDPAKNLADDGDDKKHEKDSVSFLKRTLSHISFDAFYSTDWLNRNLKSEGTATTTQSQTDYYKDEKSNYVFHTGLRINYRLSKHWSFSFGGNYSTFSQTSYADNIYVQSDSLYETEHNGHQPNQGQGPGSHGGGHGGPGGNHGGPGGGHSGGGNPGGSGGQGGGWQHNDSLHFIVHTSCGTINLDNSFATSNYNSGDVIEVKTSTTQFIEYINIPVTFRYQFGKGSFEYYIDGGGSMSIAIKDEVTLDIEGHESQSGRIDGLKKSYYSLIADGGVGYYLNKKMKVFLEPNLRYAITPINEDNTVISYPYYFGLRFGFGIGF